jgi:hypothetical protein
MVILDRDISFVVSLFPLPLQSCSLLMQSRLVKKKNICPRDGKVKAGPRTKHDYLHHLFFCPLIDGNFFCTQDIEMGCGKSSIHWDFCHVLQAIVEGLDNELQWPDVDQQRELASTYAKIFNGFIVHWYFQCKGV